MPNKIKQMLTDEEKRTITAYGDTDAISITINLSFTEYQKLHTVLKDQNRSNSFDAIKLNNMSFADPRGPVGFLDPYCIMKNFIHFNPKASSETWNKELNRCLEHNKIHQSAISKLTDGIFRL